MVSYQVLQDLGSIVTLKLLYIYHWIYINGGGRERTRETEVVNVSPWKHRKEMSFANPKETRSKYGFIFFLYIFVLLVNGCFLRCGDYSSWRYNMHLCDKNFKMYILSAKQTAISSASFLVQKCRKHNFIVLNKRVVKINEDVLKGLCSSHRRQ